MSLPALDKMIAIADAFDRDSFTGIDKVDTNTVAAVVGLQPAVVSRLLKRLGFEQVSPYRSDRVRHDRIYEYPPRIKLPDLKRVRHPDTRLIIDSIADHSLPRQFSTRLLYRRLGDNVSQGTIGARGHLPKSLHDSLVRLGFTTHRPEGHKERERTIHPATWRPPTKWPALFMEHRRLRRNGLGLSAIDRMTFAAAKLGDLINIALGNLDFEGVPYDRKGALIAAIREIVVEAFDVWLPQQTKKKGELPAKIDWSAVAALSDGHLRNFASIAARVSASEANDNPGAYALRWVQENLPGAGTDVALGVNAKT